MEYTQPVKVGDELEVTVFNIGEKGDGISRYENFVIILPESEVGKTYNVRINKVFEKFAIAKRLE